VKIGEFSPKNSAEPDHYLNANTPNPRLLLKPFARDSIVTRKVRDKGFQGADRLIQMIENTAPICLIRDLNPPWKCD